MYKTEFQPPKNTPLPHPDYTSPLPKIENKEKSTPELSFSDLQIHYRSSSPLSQESSVDSSNVIQCFPSPAYLIPLVLAGGVALIHSCFSSSKKEEAPPETDDVSEEAKVPSTKGKLAKKKEAPAPKAQPRKKNTAIEQTASLSTETPSQVRRRKVHPVPVSDDALPNPFAAPPFFNQEEAPPPKPKPKGMSQDEINTRLNNLLSIIQEQALSLPKKIAQDLNVAQIKNRSGKLTSGMLSRLEAEIQEVIDLSPPPALVEEPEASQSSEEAADPLAGILTLDTAARSYDPSPCPPGSRLKQYLVAKHVINDSDTIQIGHQGGHINGTKTFVVIIGDRCYLLFEAQHSAGDGSHDNAYKIAESCINIDMTKDREDGIRVNLTNFFRHLEGKKIYFQGSTLYAWDNRPF